MIDNRRVCAIIPLLYGLDFLPYAMRSVLDTVDEFLILYALQPNHGAHESPFPCPDTRDDLLEAAFSVAPAITRWFDGVWNTEGAQFDDGRAATDADIVIKLDADEIWPPDMLRNAIMHGLKESVREVRVPLVHAWRSFYRGFPDDPACPGRIWINGASGETTYWDQRIFHTGYAQKLDIVRYKMSVHGHGPEFKNKNWFEDVYVANRQYDCHPIGSSAWMHVESITPPDFMLCHPFAQLEIIE
jgi:hypothetical protein